MTEKGQKLPPRGEGLPESAIQQKDPAGRHRQDTNAADAAGSSKQPGGGPRHEEGPAPGEDVAEPDKPARGDAPPPGEDATKDMDDPDHVPGP